MDAQFADDFVIASLTARAKELQEECDNLETRVNEVETLYERKLSEVDRLRQTIKNDQAVKQSTLLKLAQIDFAGPTSSMVSCASQWKSIASKSGNYENESMSTDDADGENESRGEKTSTVASLDPDLQRRILELELRLVSKERENLSKHKAIIDHFEKILEEKRQRSVEKEEEINGVQQEMDKKQRAIDQFRRDNGLSMNTCLSPSSTISTLSL